jgi:hypothetical protein
MILVLPDNSNFYKTKESSFLQQGFPLNSKIMKVKPGHKAVKHFSGQNLTLIFIFVAVSRG